MNNGSFIVEGNCKLSGEITPQGAKNEALQIISGCLLTDKPMTINNIPNIIDVRKLISLIKGLGVKVEKHNDNKYTFTADSIDLKYFASKEYLPGGDKIGRRRLDTHFHGFIALGAEFKYEESTDEFFLAAEKLKGTYLHMDEISVTGTGNVVMAATLAEGTTTIYNAACEPYIQQLSKMLNRMGAKIEGIGSNLLKIEGVRSLNGTEHTILPDMIEIGSLIGLAATTQSSLRIKDVRLDALGLIPSVFQKLGIKMSFDNDDIIIPEQDIYEIQNFIDGSILTIYDSPWPGFTPDLLSIILVTAIQAKGSVLIHQKMFESRLFFTDKLIEMGAQIILCDPHRATVIGLERKSQLRGITMSSPDIRAGVSLLIAALSAKSPSRIDNIQQIDRGYERIDERLNALGANIQRV